MLNQQFTLVPTQGWWGRFRFWLGKQIAGLREVCPAKKTYAMGSPDPKDVRTSFSGIDCTPILIPRGADYFFEAVKIGKPELLLGKDRRILNEVQGISWMERPGSTETVGGVKHGMTSGAHLDLRHPQVSGTCILTLFDEDPLPSEWWKDHDLILDFGHERNGGKHLVLRLTNFQILERGMGISVDDLITDCTYKFQADRVVWDGVKGWLEVVPTPPRPQPEYLVR